MSQGASYKPADRRPLASRDLEWIKATASWLTQRNVSPNGISAASTVFALCGAAALCAIRFVEPGPARSLWLAAALCVQLRLLANLLDGMVALASGKASALGELYNEVPDRISDAVLLVALGFVSGSSPHLGYAAAVLAVFVAYVRAVGAAAGAGQVFAGVMAKPQRMFLVTLLCLFHAFSPASWQGPWLGQELGAAGGVLVVICIGCVVTACTRLATIAGTLRHGP